MPYLAIATPRVSAHLRCMSNESTNGPKRATVRPAGFTAPPHWINPPLPEPRAVAPGDDPDGLDPTRFGDWERNGIAIDF
jgi:hypothetical protein